MQCKKEFQKLSEFSLLKKVIHVLQTLISLVTEDRHDYITNHNEIEIRMSRKLKFSLFFLDSQSYCSLLSSQTVDLDTRV